MSPKRRLRLGSLCRGRAFGGVAHARCCVLMAFRLMKRSLDVILFRAKDFAKI